MKLLKGILFESIDKFKYFLPEKNIQEYQRNKMLFALLAFFISSAYMMVENDYSMWFLIPVIMLVFYKLPYFYYSLVHNQNTANVVSAIPLWVNMIYALIEKNTIHNAIKNSLDEDTSSVIANDLREFIEQIERDPNSKSAYLNFLKRYKIDGFTDIMLKLYEYKNLSKDKLKYEIRNLNVDLGKIEEQKRKNQFKNEDFMVDTLTCFVIFIPCIYMCVISLMPSLFSV